MSGFGPEANDIARFVPWVGDVSLWPTNIDYLLDYT
jgi:hypothetical protein